MHGKLAWIYPCIHLLLSAYPSTVAECRCTGSDNSKKNDSKRNIRNVAMSRVKIHIRKKLMKSPSFFYFSPDTHFFNDVFLYKPLWAPNANHHTVGCNVIPRCWSLQNKSFSIQIISDIQLDWIIYLIIIHYWRC